ncbi:MAG: hypothetical protein CME06_09060 [Gemmatimonadetes bacterium]|nr:hypothetical protein [Gemmatimonadota bacterium]
MNETRSAWALFFAIAVFYVFWIAVEPQAPIPEGPPVRESAQVGEESVRAIERVEVDAAEEATIEMPSRRVVVRGERLEVVLDTRGAAIVGARILDHVYGRGHMLEGSAVALFDGSEGGEQGGVYLVDRVGGLLDLSQRVFECTAGDEVDLRGRDGVELVFALELEDGTSARRTYTFSSALHSFESRLDFAGPTRVGSYESRWGIPLELTESHVKMDKEHFKGLLMEDASLDDVKLKDVEWGETIASSESVDWVGARTRYFMVAMIPAERAGVGAEIAGIGPAGEPEGFELALTRKQVGAASFSDRQSFYVGPLDYDELRGLGRDLDRAVDFGGSFLRPISKVIFGAMVVIRKVIPSYGLVIIVVSLLVKGIFWPLTHKSFESSAKMRALSPKIKQLQEKYKSNPQKQQQETMKLYREHGVNPLGGCLPMIVQMPVLYALFIVFRSTIAFRGEPFLGYIPDLSAPDPYWILPLLMGVSMLIQQKVMAQMMTDPRQKMMGYMMPVIFTALFLNMPSGLVLYWTVSNLASILQQILINRRSVEGASI